MRIAFEDFQGLVRGSCVRDDMLDLNPRLRKNAFHTIRQKTSLVKTRGDDGKLHLQRVGRPRRAHLSRRMAARMGGE